MMKPISFLFYLFYLTVFVNATKPVISKNQRYIITLKPTTDIDDFIPNLLKGIFDLIGDVIGDIGDLLDGAHLDKRTNPVHIFESFDIEGSYKAISTKIEKNDLLGSILGHFDEITSIVPDEIIQFELPKPQSLHRRYYMRNSPIEYESHITKNTSSSEPGNSTKPHVLQQTNAPWNLARISERKLDTKAPYLYPDTAGTGVRVYVIDDGINKDHKDFNGRASWGYSAIGDGDDVLIGGGHGSHVAGIIGGEQFGVAKNVTMVSVQVLKKNGQGSVSSLLSGIQWAAKDAKKYPKKSIVNMSLGVSSLAPSANTLNDAITAAAKGGLPIIVAAGNSGTDACDYVPAGNPLVYTVGASDNKDTLDPKSCWGKCVSIIAPGVNVESDYIGGTNATATMSGTSMAAPHVTGIAALILQDLHDPTPKNLFAALTKYATKGVIQQNQPHTVNLLAFNDVTLSKSDNTTTKAQPSKNKKSTHKKKSGSKKKKHTPKKHVANKD
ncbi:peptidase S8/S53 domain-containing protein [Halteromyces radiatus]|uniref:peptidase S8/S53 domain-containing protein n=1 Tax=Halteromyces radiatus TaxID=101107 RepID=UPI00221ECA79|nr:peptidase S8/S53 domain-containing protein [Halteromyces radiatus]KAI8086654.1 peptidase S8/S53 domain-containing protein [Halteromyces radiatus]